MKNMESKTYKPFLKGSELWAKEVNPFGDTRSPCFGKPYCCYANICKAIAWQQAEHDLKSFKVNYAEYYCSGLGDESEYVIKGTLLFDHKIILVTADINEKNELINLKTL